MRRGFICFLSMLLLFLLFGCSESKQSKANKVYITSTGIRESNSTHTTEVVAEQVHVNYSEDGTFSYVITNDAVIITGVHGSSPNIIIPSHIEGYPVTSIGSNAFIQNSSCLSVTLPNTIVSIENGAFYRCYSLEKIEVPESVTFIASDAFFRTPNLLGIFVKEGNSHYCDIDGVLYSADQSTLLIYPEGLRRSEYTLPNSVNAIGETAFGYCPAVEKLIVPSRDIAFPHAPLAAICSDFTIAAEPNSTAEKYATDWGLSFVSTGSGAGQRSTGDGSLCSPNN